MTVFAIVTDTVQLVPDTLEHPDHDLKIASGAGVALSVTLPPFATCAVHVPVVQEIPEPSIVPFPETTVVSA